jgi:peptidoglycan/xylan/chitin deacetylase (PgdA/CDA1 family)
MLTLGGVAGIVVAVVVAIAIGSSGGGGGGGGSKGAGRRASASDTPKQRTTGTLPDGASAAVVAKGDATIQRLARLGLPIYCAGTHGDEVAFTFDDGPGPYTYLAIKKLRQAHERATFFVVGRSMDNYPNHLRAELTVAALGDHTYTHPELTALAPSQISSEIARTKQKIERDSQQPVYLFRPPYGAINSTVEQIAKGLNLLPILWTDDSADSLGANYAGIIHNAEQGLHPGWIILFHENRGQTIRALTTLLPELLRRHLRSVTLPELFATDPPSVAQVREGGRGCGVSTLPTSGTASAG